MTKAYSRFLTAFFCLFLGGLLVWHVLLPDRAKSETENRTLAQFPVFSWSSLVDGSYTEGVEEYFADQFPLRDGWTGLKARAEQLIGKSEFNGVYLCGDTLISKVDRPNQSLVDKNLSYVDRLEGKTDIPVHLGLIPSAAEVWRDKLPAGADSWDQTALLGNSDIGFWGALSAHGDEAIYYRTDHHWTTLGVLFRRQISANFETCSVIVGNLPASPPVRKIGRRTACLSLTLNWMMCSRMCSARQPPPSLSVFWTTLRRKSRMFLDSAPST